MRIKSPSFDEGTDIPERHTGDGADVSVPLVWEGVPAGTAELALILDDPNAPSKRPWVHWLIWGIPAYCAGLEEGLPRTERLDEPDGARQGRNSWSNDDLGYRGPAPPRGHGPHHYHFRLYALDRPLDVAPGADRATLDTAMRGHVLAEAELTAVYER